MYLSEMLALTPLWTPILIVLAIPLIIVAYDLQNWYHLPRGPVPVPFIGNTLSLPRSKLYLYYNSLSHIYGPIFTLFMGRRPTIIISSPTVAHRLLTTRSTKYSSRPRSVMFGEVFSRMSSILVQAYGPSWSLRRKLLHQSLGPALVSTFKPRQYAEASRLTFNILKTPEAWASSIERLAASVVFSIAYGRRIDTLEAKVVKERKKWVHYMASIMIPGAYLAESLRFLIYLPDILAPWKKHVREMGDQETAFNIELVDAVREDLKKAGGKGAGSLTESMLKWQQEGGPGVEMLANPRYFAGVPSSIFNAGFDSTSSTIQTAIFALITHPSTLLAARTELDEVVGTSRSPTFKDQPQLPYLSALIKEVLRWRPVFPFGLPHSTSEDDQYEGWKIPKGTTIIANCLAMNHSEQFFPSPHLFAPERYLPASDSRFNPELAGDEFPSKYGHSSFGWGRRACAGSDLASNSIWIVLAKLVWGFDFTALDSELAEKKYDMDAFTDGMLMKPKPFRAVFGVRSLDHREVLETDMGEAEVVLERFPRFD